MVALLSTLLLAMGCQTAPTCADIMSEPATGPVDPAWAKRGLSLAPDAVPCAGDDRRLHVIEATTAEPHVRAIALREELTRQGWAANGPERYEKEGDYVVRLRRGNEVFMFNVHRASKISSVLPDTPALAIHAAVGSHAAAPPHRSPPHTAGGTKPPGAGGEGAW